MLLQVNIIVDENDVILHWDNSCEKLFGYKSHEIVGENLKMLLPEVELLDGVRTEVVGVLKNGLDMPLMACRQYFKRDLEHIGIVSLSELPLNEQFIEFQDKPSEATLKIIDEVLVGAMILDFNGSIVNCNETASRWLGVSRVDLIGKRFIEYLDPRKSEDTWSNLQQVQFKEENLSYHTFTMVPGKGGQLAVNARISVCSLADSGDQGYLIVINDRTEMDQFEQDLISRERFVRAVLQSSPIVFYIYDMKEKKSIFSNQGISRILGYSKLGGIETGKGFFPDLIHSEDQDSIVTYHNMIRDTVQDKIHEIRYRVKAADDSWHWMFSRDSVLKRDNSGNVIQIVGTAQDITGQVKAQEEIIALNISLEDRVKKRTEELRKANKELERMATTDYLTGIMNRRSFLTRAEEEASRCRRYGHIMSFVMIDLDHFKQINDTYGHDAGDIVLKRVTAFVYNSLRKSDLFGRLGGEEFGILLVETRAADAMAVTDRIRQKISEMPIQINPDQEIRVSFSSGLVDTRDSAHLDELQKLADDALYKAKRCGRDRVVRWFPNIKADEEC